MTALLDTAHTAHDPGGKVRLAVDASVKSEAVFSACGTRRTLLTRCWDESLPSIMFIGMNPSTADVQVDDPTVRKECGYARRWGYGGIIKCNVMDYRATDPRTLLTVGPSTPNNLDQIQQQLNRVSSVVAVWGRLPPVLKCHAQAVAQLLVNFPGTVLCLGVNQDGSPRHPLYLRNDLKPVPFEARSVL